jgi:hypothetical protein
MTVFGAGGRVPVRAELALTVIAVLWAAPARAQSAEALAADCAARGGDPGLCALAGAGVRDLTGDLGLLAGAGADIPGPSSTLGRRLGGMPRLAPFVRVGGHTVVASDFGDATGSSETSKFVPSLQAGLGLGVFDGFRLLPTVGGFLSFDVVVQGSFVFLPEDSGFDGRVDALSLGARLAILRESFTLPAVTLSYAHRLVGVATLGEVGGGDLAEVVVDPTVNSWRATVGKDLFAFGLSGGIGWDDYAADAALRVSDGGGGFRLYQASYSATRRMYFLGLTRQISVLSWLAAEVGWTEGQEPLSAAGVVSPDRGRMLYGTLAALVKL